MPADRDRTIEALTAAFAAGELSMDEFERRVETANRTDDAATLRQMLSDLPPEYQLLPQGFTTTGSSSSAKAKPYGRDWKDAAWHYRDRYRHGPQGPDATYSMGTRGSADNSMGCRGRGKADQVAIFSSSRRVGRWTLAKKLDSVAIFGSCLIDLRQADIIPEGGRIEAVALFGSVQILVPPGLNVRVSGVPIFGSVTGSGDIIGDDDAPWIDIEGVAIFGSVEIKVVP